MSPRAACDRLATLEQFRAANPECGCTLTDEEVTEALDDASDLVYQLSGGVIFGSCSVTVRPQRACWCDHCAGCCEIDFIPLRGPVISVDEITIDGEVLDDDDWALTSDGRVYRTSTDGLRPDPWPCCQSLWRPLGEEDTFSIEYTFGQATQPSWVRNGVIELAADLAGFFKTKRSKLPSTVTAITYLNVSATLQSRAEALAEGNVSAAMPALSQIIAIVNPRGSQSWMYSPDSCYAWSFPTV